jgi:hypothetical protein
MRAIRRSFLAAGQLLALSGASGLLLGTFPLEIHSAANPVPSQGASPRVLSLPDCLAEANVHHL